MVGIVMKLYSIEDHRLNVENLLHVNYKVKSFILINSFDVL